MVFHDSGAEQCGNTWRLLKTGKQFLILTGRNGRGNCIAALRVTLFGFKELAPSYYSLVSECLLGIFILVFKCDCFLYKTQ